MGHPGGGGVSDIWRITGPTFGPYSANQIDVSIGDSGTLNLQVEGFGGFAALFDYGGKTGYQIDVTRGGDTLSLVCTVEATSCHSADSSSIHGFTISNFIMSEIEANLVASFANAAAPGTGTNISDIAVRFDYSATSAVPSHPRCC